MKTQLERVEIECTFLSDHDLAIEHTTSRQLLQYGINQFREITVQRLLVAAFNEDFFSIAKDKRAKAAPFGFEDPSACFGEFADAFCKHRENRRVNREFHNQCNQF